MFEALKKKGYQIEFVSHALAILQIDFPDAAAELEEVILRQSIPIEEIIGSGGGETKGTQRLRNGLTAKGWTKEIFTIKKTINDEPRESISHKVDHVRLVHRKAESEIESLSRLNGTIKIRSSIATWRTSKRLHSEGGISLGVMVTRGTSLQDNILSLVRPWVDEKQIDTFERLSELGIEQTSRQRREVLRRVQRTRNPIPFRDAWASQFVSDKFGAATTHWRKLDDRIKRGVGNPCPLLLIGLPAAIVTFGEDPQEIKSLIEAGAQALEEDEE